MNYIPSTITQDDLNSLKRAVRNYVETEGGQKNDLVSMFDFICEKMYQYLIRQYTPKNALDILYGYDTAFGQLSEAIGLDGLLEDKQFKSDIQNIFHLIYIKYMSSDRLREAKELKERYGISYEPIGFGIYLQLKEHFPQLYDYFFKRAFELKSPADIKEFQNRLDTLQIFVVSYPGGKVGKSTMGESGNYNPMGNIITLYTPSDYTNVVRNKAEDINKYEETLKEIKPDLPYKERKGMLQEFKRQTIKEFVLNNPEFMSVLAHEVGHVLQRTKLLQSFEKEEGSVPYQQAEWGTTYKTYHSKERNPYEYAAQREMSMLMKKHPELFTKSNPQYYAQQEYNNIVYERLVLTFDPKVREFETDKVRKFILTDDYFYKYKPSNVDKLDLFALLKIIRKRLLAHYKEIFKDTERKKNVPRYSPDYPKEVVGKVMVELVRIADKLDGIGLLKEADAVDGVTFEELMSNDYENELKPTFIYTLAQLSTTEDYKKMAPEKIYNKMVEGAEKIDKENKEYERKNAGAESKIEKFAEKIIMYHGTSGENLDRILSQGFVPVPKFRTWDETRREKGYESKESLPGVYLTDNYGIASSSAQNTILEQAKTKPESEHPYQTKVWRKGFIIAQIETRSPDVRLDEDIMDEPSRAINLRDIVSDWYREFNAVSDGILTTKTWGKENLDTWTQAWSDELKKKGFPERRVENLKPYIKELIDKWMDYRMGLVMEREASGIQISEYGGERYLTDRGWGRGFVIKLTDHYRKPLAVPGYDVYEYDDPDLENKKDKLVNAVGKFTEAALIKYRVVLDNFLKQAKEYVDIEWQKKKGDKSWRMFNVRVTEPVGFRGANKILVAIEEIDEGWEKPHKLYIRYNKDEEALQRFLEQYKTNSTENFQLIR